MSPSLPTIEGPRKEEGDLGKNDSTFNIASIIIMAKRPSDINIPSCQRMHDKGVLEKMKKNIYTKSFNLLPKGEFSEGDSKIIF